MVNSNHVGVSRNGGFHSYFRSPQPNLAVSPSPALYMLNHPGNNLSTFEVVVTSGYILPSPDPTCGIPLAIGMSRGLLVHHNQEIVVTAKDSECAIREQDHFMPTTNVVRIMRKILPPQAKISDESKVTIQECITEFICFVTGEANHRCQQEQRKTITTEDLLWAMDNLGFDNYVEPLSLFLHTYRQFDGRGSLKGEPLVLKRPMVDSASGCNIMPYHLPPNFLMAHHHGSFVFPPTMTRYMQADTSNGSSSQSTVAAVDSEVDSPSKEGRSD